MRQARWRTSDDPELMLDCEPSRVSPRKLRLFACACCRHLLPHFSDAHIRRTLAFAERVAEGDPGGDDERRALGAALDKRYATLYPGHGAPSPATLALSAVTDAAFATDPGGAARSAMLTGMEAIATAEALAVPDSEYDARHDAVAGEVKRYYAGLLREIVGCPFNPPSRDPAWDRWNHQAIVTLARSIYESSSFVDLPILADALEECGNADPSLVQHCRAPVEHVRGCWALDCICGL